MELYTSVATIIERVGLPLAMLLFIVWTGHKEYWVFGSVHKRVLEQTVEWQKRADKWQELAFKGTRTAERAVELATSVKRQSEE